MKPKRIVDKKLLSLISKQEACLICHRRPVDPDHITTRGAGGDDTLTNVWPLCRREHQERHRHGLGYMVDKYPVLKRWLISNGREDVLEGLERKKKKVSKVK